MPRSEYSRDTVTGRSLCMAVAHLMSSEAFQQWVTFICTVAALQYSSLLNNRQGFFCCILKKHYKALVLLKCQDGGRKKTVQFIIRLYCTWKDFVNASMALWENQKAFMWWGLLYSPPISVYLKSFLSFLQNISYHSSLLAYSPVLVYSAQQWFWRLIFKESKFSNSSYLWQLLSYGKEYFF